MSERIVPVEFMLGEALLAGTDGVLDERPPLEYQREQTLCRHPRSVLHEDRRVIECKDCGALMDACQWLVLHSREWSNIAHWVKSMREEKHRLSDEVFQLKRELAKLKGAVKRKREQAAR